MKNHLIKVGNTGGANMANQLVKVGNVMTLAWSARKTQKHHQMRIAMARSPFQKTIESFDFKSQPLIDPKLIRELASGRYMQSGDIRVNLPKDTRSACMIPPEPCFRYLA